MILVFSDQQRQTWAMRFLREQPVDVGSVRYREVLRVDKIESEGKNEDGSTWHTTADLSMEMVQGLGVNGWTLESSNNVVHAPEVTAGSVAGKALTKDQLVFWTDRLKPIFTSELQKGLMPANYEILTEQGFEVGRVYELPQFAMAKRSLSAARLNYLAMPADQRTKGQSEIAQMSDADIAELAKTICHKDPSLTGCHARESVQITPTMSDDPKLWRMEYRTSVETSGQTYKDRAIWEIDNHVCVFKLKWELESSAPTKEFTLLSVEYALE